MIRIPLLDRILSQNQTEVHTKESNPKLQKIAKEIEELANDPWKLAVERACTRGRWGHQVFIKSADTAPSKKFVHETKKPKKGE
jgi:hypothetical protein